MLVRKIRIPSLAGNEPQEAKHPKTTHDQRCRCAIRPPWTFRFLLLPAQRGSEEPNRKSQISPNLAKSLAPTGCS